MTPFRRTALGAAALLVLAGLPAEAAWNNAFQATCFKRRASYYAPPPVVAHSAPVVAHAPPADPCAPCCSTSYVQRCYYQPVTSYKTVMEPVTSYRTSYYYEPVRSYRSSCYYDPCTGSSVQVTTPVTSYRLRSQCNAVTSYVQRCVPVTTYRPTFYLEAVNNCAPGAGGPPMPGAPAPNVTDGAGNRIGPANVPMVDDPNSNYGPAGNPRRRVEPVPDPAPRRFMPPAPAKLDHVVSRPSGRGAPVAGQVVANNFVTPLRGAQLVFVSRQSRETQEAVTADRNGKFSVNLPAGGWAIYMARADGSLAFHSSIDIAEGQGRQVMVVSR